MREDDGFRAAARLFVKEVDAVDEDGWHFFVIPTLSGAKGREPYCNEFLKSRAKRGSPTLFRIFHSE